MELTVVSMLDKHCAIAYAYRAAAAAKVAYEYAQRGAESAAAALLEKTREDAYCAAGHAWKAVNGELITLTEFAFKDAWRNSEIAALRIIRALNAALDVDPFAVKILEAGCVWINDLEDALTAYRSTILDVIEARPGQDRTPLPGLDAQAIEAKWVEFLAEFPDTLSVPDTLATLADSISAGPLFVPAEDGKLSKEAIAAAIASELGHERRPRNQCRYCDKQFIVVPESSTSGVCVECDERLSHELRNFDSGPDTPSSDPSLN